MRIFGPTLKWICLIALAAGTTAVAWKIDRNTRSIRATQGLTAIARQLVLQIDTLTVLAKEKGEREPYLWAIEKMSQSIEPRAIRASRFQTRPGQIVESATIDMSGGHFEYLRNLAPEQGLGIRIQIDQPPSFFLGTSKQLYGDSACLVVFILVLSGLGLLFRGRTDAQPLLESSENQNVKEMTRLWLRDAKTLLVELGIQIRETIRQAHDLTLAANKSRHAVSELRGRIHTQLNEVHQSREALKGAIGQSQQFETLVLNVVLEASRLGQNGAHLIKVTEELRKQASNLRQAHLKSEESILDLERSLEPIAMDADLAFHSFEPVFKTAQDMDGYIRKTTQIMVNQAKLIQNASGQISEPDLKNATHS